MDNLVQNLAMLPNLVCSRNQWKFSFSRNQKNHLVLQCLNFGVFVCLSLNCFWNFSPSLSISILKLMVFFFLVPFSLISICEYCLKKQELVIKSSSSLWFVAVVFMFCRNNFIPLQLGFIIMNFCSCIIQSSN